MPNGITTLSAYQQGGRVDPTRREFLERLARSGLGAFLSQNLPGIGELPVEQMGVGASLAGSSKPNFYPELGRGFWTGPTSVGRMGDVVIGPSGSDLVHKVTGEARPFWSKGGPPGHGFMDWLSSADDIYGPALAPEMTAHGVTHPSMRAALLEEGAKMAPGEVIDPDILLERIGYNTEIGKARVGVEAYRTAIKEVSEGGGRYGLPNWSKEEQVAHYGAQKRKYEEGLAELLRANARSDEAVRRTGGMFFGPRYNEPGILSSPSVRPSPSTAGRWGMRGIAGLLGALGLGIGTAVDLAASPTKLGSGDIPKEDPRSDEDKIKYYEDLMRLGRELGVGQHRPSILQLSREINGPSIRSSYPMGR